MSAVLHATTSTPAVRRGRLAIDRRLLWVVAIGAALLLGELAMRGWEAQQQLQSELQKVRSRAAVLAAGSDQMDWASRTRAAEAERAALQMRLWRAPSEAQAQARLRDWLSNALLTANVVRPSVSLLPLQAAAAASAASAGSAGGTTGAVRVRASVTFDLAPKVLEEALLQIEAGGQLARVDSLTASTRSRRVEMTVSVPVLIIKELPAEDVLEASKPAAKPGLRSNAKGQAQKETSR
jgi:hypothetical protein